MSKVKTLFKNAPMEIRESRYIKLVLSRTNPATLFVSPIISFFQHKNALTFLGNILFARVIWLISSIIFVFLLSACTNSSNEGNKNIQTARLLEILKNRLKTDEIYIRSETRLNSEQSHSLLITVTDSPLLNDSCYYPVFINSSIVLITDSLFRSNSLQVPDLKITISKTGSDLSAEAQYSPAEINLANKCLLSARNFINGIENGDFVKLDSLISIKSMGLDYSEMHKQYDLLNKEFGSRKFTCEGFLVAPDAVTVMIHFENTPRCSFWELTYLNSDNGRLSGFEGG